MRTPPPRIALCAALLACASVCPRAFGSPAPSSCDHAGLRLPERPSQSLSGSAFAKATERLEGAERDEAIVAQLLSGNAPEFLRRAHPVTLRGRLLHGGEARITVCALPDYLAIGSDADHVLVPLGLPAAWSAATRLGFSLPTAKMVDAIHRQARARLTPEPLPAGPLMSSTAYYWAHSQMSQRQRQALGARGGELVAGHKKDLVVSNQLWSRPGRVAIYGWHRPDGSLIQPLSLAHQAAYADYSHGVRLIAPLAYLNGARIPLISLMSDPETAGILSDEGALRPL